MVKFKTLKYKHQREAKELSAKIQAGEASSEDINLFVLGMVAEWDFVDAETGSPLPIDKSGLEEMSIQQFQEMNRLFNEAMEVGVAAVPKVNGGPSPSGSTVSSPKKRSRQPRRNG